MENGKKRKRFLSLVYKINGSILIMGIILIGVVSWLISEAVSVEEYDLVSDRLEADMRYLKDELGENDGKQWSVRDGALYIGDTLIGDGTIENANEEPFLKCEEITHTFFYSFIKTDNDDELTWVEDGKYQQGHYLRTAGSTKGKNGEQIEGTYMDKIVADGLEASEDGVYIDIANVEGRLIYCHYELIRDKDGQIIGSIVNGISVNDLQDRVRYIKIMAFVLSFIIIFILFVILSVVVYRILKAIKKIRAHLDKIGTGEFPKEPLVIIAKDELGEVANTINDMVDSLKEKERIGAELSLATDIQSHMLPTVFPPYPDIDSFDIYASMNPAKEVGGDFYDFFLVDEDHIAVVIADVSGKGIPAALFMAITKTLIKNHTQVGLSPADVFTRVNNLLMESNESGMFITAWMGMLDIRNGNLTFVNAGHNPPCIMKEGGKFEFLRTKPGLVLAGMEGIRYKQYEVDLKPGDKLFLYTDGVTESSDIDQKFYGENRLLNYLNEHTLDDVKTIVEGVTADIESFVRGAEQFDDTTMLVLDFKKYKEGEGIERIFDADLSVFPEANDFVEEELDRLCCPMKQKMMILVAFEEVFVNVAKYAYDFGNGKIKIKLKNTLDPKGIEITFVDRGMPFDPLAKKDPDTTLSAEEREVGGLGIYIVKKNMDEVDYKYENGQNILTIYKEF